MQFFYPYNSEIQNDDELQDDFIYWAYSVYWKVDVSPRRFLHSPDGKGGVPKGEQLSLIQDLYYQGFILLKYIHCSYDEFYNAILHKTGSYPISSYVPEIRYLSRRQCYNYHNKKFRHKLKYQKKSNHTKKEYSTKELSKLDWRISKGFNKDRNDKKHSSNRRTFAKKLSNKYHRQWERSTIHKEKWDDLFDGTNKNIFDPWMWD